MTATLKYWLSKELVWQIICASTAVLIGIWHLSGLDTSHSWGDDFAQYIKHAVNLADGVTYKKTGHIVNPTISIAPETYPPVFPMLLAPVYAIWGLNIVAFKAVVVVCFILFLLLIYPVFKNKSLPALPFFIVLLIGLSPYFYSFRQNVLSEYPFLMFLFLCCWVVQRAHKEFHSETKQWLYYIAIGVSLYLVFGTRTIGIVLVPSFVGAEILSATKPRKWYFKTAASLAAFGLLLILQKLYLNSEGEGYVYQLEYYFNQNTISGNASIFKHEFSLLWSGYNDDIRKAIFKGGIVLAIIGWLMCIWKRLTIAEFFVPLYLLIILIWPMNQGIRFLIPLVPFFFFYVFYGLYQVLRRSETAFYSSAFWVLLLLLLPHLSIYKAIAAGRNNSIDNVALFPGAEEVFSFVRSTPPESRFHFAKPRLLALYTNREASVLNCESQKDNLYNSFKTYRITHILIQANPSLEHENCLKDWLDRNQENTELVFNNDLFLIYTLK